MNRPHTTVILAMTADGKIAPYDHSAACFGSDNDKAHLERQIAGADGVLFGGGTLRAYGTTLSVSNPQLLEERKQQCKPLQPVQIVCSAGAKFDTDLKFFQQNVPRWLLTTDEGGKLWQEKLQFEQILAVEKSYRGGINWHKALSRLLDLGIAQLAVIGGGKLIFSLLEENLIDEFWLTVCPLILGGETAPTPVAGKGFLPPQSKSLVLLSVEKVAGEIFLHYQVQH